MFFNREQKQWRFFSRALCSAAALALAAAGCGGGGGGSQPAPAISSAGSAALPPATTTNSINLAVDTSGARGPIPVQISASNIRVDSGSTVDTPFQRAWQEGSVISLSVPEGIGDRQFQKWLRNGQELSSQPAIQLTAAGADTLTAVYAPRLPGPDGFMPNYAREVDTSDNQPNRLLRWPGLPVRVYFENNGSLTPERRRQTLSGFDLWVRATGGILAYQVTGDRSEAHITVAFEDKGDTGYLGQTTVSFLDPDAVIVRADTVFNLHYLQSGDLVLVAAHEFGHALGIGGHSSDGSDLMYPTGSRYARLSVRDINTVETAYRDLFGRRYHPRVHDPDAPIRAVRIRCPF